MFNVMLALALLLSVSPFVVMQQIQQSVSMHRMVQRSHALLLAKQLLTLQEALLGVDEAKHLKAVWESEARLILPELQYHVSCDKQGQCVLAMGWGGGWPDHFRLQYQLASGRYGLHKNQMGYPFGG